MKKLILLSFVILSLTQLTKAQEKNYWAQIKEEHLNEGLLKNEEFFEKSEFIFEGKEIREYEKSYDAKGNLDPQDFYSTKRIIVTTVYKGDKNLLHDTICLVMKGGLCRM